MLRLGAILFQRSRWLQIVALIVVWWLSELLVRALELPLPGGIIGMAIVLMLLISGRVPTTWVSRGTTGLLDHLVLFFVPAVMALLDHRELLSMVGLKVFVVIAVSTVAVMVVTAIVVDICFHWSRTDV